MPRIFLKGNSKEYGSGKSIPVKRNFFCREQFVQKNYLNPSVENYPQWIFISSGEKRNAIIKHYKRFFTV